MNDNPNVILKRAVDAIVEQINDNHLTPQSAAVKVAQDMDLNPNFIKRASEVINVALTYNHFKKHADCKEVDFPIVDADKAIDTIYGPNTKKAESSDVYAPSIDPAEINFNKYLNNTSFKQACAEIRDTKEDYTSYGLSDKAICEKSAHYQDRLDKEVDDLQTKLAGVKFATTRTFSKLLSSFAKDENYRTKFAEFESQVFSREGDIATPFLDFIHKTAGLEEARGDHDANYKMFDTCKEAQEFRSFLTTNNEAYKLAQELAEVEARQTEFKTFVQNLNHEHNKQKRAALIENLNPFINVEKVAEVEQENECPIWKLAQQKKAEQFMVENDSADEDKYLSEGQKKLPAKLKRSIITSKKVSGKMNQPEINMSQEKIAFDFVKTIMDQYGNAGKPSTNYHANSVDENRNRKMMLENLMATDPILSTSDPKRVVDSYGLITRLAPQMSQEKEIVRSSLRQMVSSQAVTPYDAEQFVKTNTGMLKQKMLQDGKPVSGGKD